MQIHSSVVPKGNYIITSHGFGLYDVYNEANGRRYEVDMRPGMKRCSCPHWHFRIKRPGNECKHHKLVRARGAWNEKSPFA